MKPNDIVVKFGRKGKSRGEQVTLAAREIGVSRRSLYLWLSKGEIPAKTQAWIQLETGGALKAAKK